MNQATRLLAALTVAFLLATSLAFAEVPQILNYQAVLKDSTDRPIRNETRDVQFAIYEDSVDNTTLWIDTVTITTNNNGVFHTLLGAQEPIPESTFDGSVRWLGVQIEVNFEQTPRTPLVSVGYAYKAWRSDTADFALSSAGGGWVNNGNIVRLETNTDSVGIGTSSPTELLSVVGGKISINSTMAGDVLVLRNGGGGPISRANIAVNTSTLPSSEQVGARLGFIDDSTYGTHIVFENRTGSGAGTNTTEWMRLTTEGNLGIGTTTPDEKLTVDGNAHISGDLTVDGTITGGTQACWQHSGALIYNGLGPTNWSTLDLSSYVGSNYAFVVIQVYQETRDYFKFRPYGAPGNWVKSSDSDDYAANAGRISGNGASIVCLETDPTGRLEWHVGPGAGNYLLTLLGYIR